MTQNKKIETLKNNFEKSEIAFPQEKINNFLMKKLWLNIYTV